MGGSDGKNNRVNLTPAEHYIAHLFLVRMFPKNHGLVMAAALMSRDNRNGKRSNNKMYEWLRKRARESLVIFRTGKHHSPEIRAKISAILKASPVIAARAEQRRGIPRSDEAKRKLSESHKTSEKAKAAREALGLSRRGIRQSPEHLAKLSAVRKGRVMPQEQRDKIGAALKGKPKSAEHVAKVSAALMGKPGTRRGAVLSEETKQRMRVAATGRVMSAESIVNMTNSRTHEQRREGALKAWETKRSLNNGGLHVCKFIRS